MKDINSLSVEERARQLRNEYQRNWKANNRDKVNGYHKEWRSKNKDKIEGYNKRYWAKKAEEELKVKASNK